MKRHLALFAALLAIALPVQAEALKIGIEGRYPPFEMVDNQGNLHGFNVELGRALCEEMKVQCSFVRTEWNDLIPNLLARRIDVILSSMDITEDREKQVMFTDPYAHSPAFFVAKKGRFPFVFISPQRVEGVTIGVEENTSYDAYLSSKFADRAIIRRYKTSSALYNALAQGEVKLALMDGTAAYYGFFQTPAGQGFELVGSALKEQRYFGRGQGIALRKDELVLRDRFNKALKSLIAGGVYNSISSRHFVFNLRN
ncbi:transporter substrate-binding domain-containing protein [Chitinimonas lacunae]|uniref:Transporter substrate-binding domain-containing protein n=1 Tax=Chitinimonas lacunae TaxID=1963018 RepID=A0ABV8MUH3_9NEIS